MLYLWMVYIKKEKVVSLNPDLIKHFTIDEHIVFLVDILIENKLNFNTYYGNALIRFYCGLRCDLRKNDN